MKQNRTIIYNKDLATEVTDSHIKFQIPKDPNYKPCKKEEHDYKDVSNQVIQGQCDQTIYLCMKCGTWKVLEADGTDLSTLL